MSKDTEIPCKTILAGTIAKSLLTEVREGLSKLGTVPHLCGILANDDPSAQVYAEWTGKTCKDKYDSYYKLSDSSG